MSQKRQPRKVNPDGTFTQRVRRPDGTIVEFKSRVTAKGRRKRRRRGNTPAAPETPAKS